MAWLPLANVLHHKLRSILASLGIGIGVCMLITLTGLARGSLFEIADRWESVNADLIVMAPGWGKQVTTSMGSGLPDRYAELLAETFPDVIESVVPVFVWRVEMGGQSHNIAGVDPDDWAKLTGMDDLVAGEIYDRHGRGTAWLERTLLDRPDDEYELLELTPDDLGHPDHNCLELIVDERLARAGGYSVGQVVRMANHDWTITGIAPDGVVNRIFIPRRTAQFLFGTGDITRSTSMFVKLRPEAVESTGPIVQRIENELKVDVVSLAEQRQALMENFDVMFLYVNTVNIVALIIAFFFIAIILYTMVLQRTRDIAILKANGASNGYLVRQVMAESLLLTAAGVVVGIALSFVAQWAIESAKPFLTVTIERQWVLTAVGMAFVGAIVSSLYPAWRATRVDMVAALSLE